MLDKYQVLKLLMVRMREDLERLRRAYADARDGATNAEMKSEDRYDMRSTEASYLARGHAMQYEALEAAIEELEAYHPPVYREEDPIGKGAMVSLKQGRYTDHYYLLPKGGGTELELEDGEEVTVITTAAPLFEKLKGKKLGDSLSVVEGQPKAKIVAVL